jgi:hypothetical protein
MAKLQPRYASSTKCEFWPIFEALNNWHVVKCDQQRKGKDDELVNLAHYIVLEKETVRTMNRIEVGKVGALGTDEHPETYVYYLVKWIEEPYQVLQPNKLPGHDPPIQVPAEKWLCRFTCYNKVGQAKQWYTFLVIPVIVRLKQMYCANIPVEAENNISKLPST